MPNCRVCNLSFDAGDKMVNVRQGVHVHAACFNCTECHLPLHVGNAHFCDVTERPFCSDCYVNVYMPNCNECDLILCSDDDKAWSNGLVYHTDCLKRSLPKQETGKYQAQPSLLALRESPNKDCDQKMKQVQSIYLPSSSQSLEFHNCANVETSVQQTDNVDLDFDALLSSLQENEQQMPSASAQLPSQQLRQQNGIAPYIKEDTPFWGSLGENNSLQLQHLKLKYEEIAQQQNTSFNSKHFPSSSTANVQHLKRGSNHHKPKIPIEKKLKTDLIENQTSYGAVVQQLNQSEHHYLPNHATDNIKLYQIVPHQSGQGHHLKLVYREELLPQVATPQKPINKRNYLAETKDVSKAGEPATQSKLIYAKKTAVGTIPGPFNNKASHQTFSIQACPMVNGLSGNLEQHFPADAIQRSSTLPLLFQNPPTGSTPPVQLKTDQSKGSNHRRKSPNGTNTTAKQPNPNYIVPPGRKRAKISPEIRTMFRNIFEFDPRPDRPERERLAVLAGLNKRQVQIWFQNERNKLKTDPSNAPPLNPNHDQSLS